MNFEQSYSQQQKQVQKMYMTQQLQQSIQMLQFNQDDLMNFLSQKALGNPLIEVTVSQDSSFESMPLSASKTHSFDSDDKQNMINQIPDTHTSLFELVNEQIHLTMRNTYLRELVLWLTEYLDTNGYITITIEEASRLTGAEEIQILDALTLLQQLDPPGVGARNLQECLMLQTERDETAPNMAYLILEEAFEGFANRKWKEITKKFDITLAEIQEIYDYIQTLTPNPGAIYNDTAGQYIKPDLIVKIEENHLTVLSVKTGLPVISFQRDYYQNMQKVDDTDVKQFMKEKYMEYEWLQRSLAQRGETILRVGAAIVEKQKAFFLDPQHPIKPLVLKEIAEELKIHESTVSRSVNGKYLETRFGVFELKHFFTNALKSSKNTFQTDSSEDLSAENVKKTISELIHSEDKKSPLSDQKIADLLDEEGIEISRRTVAKYRKALQIPPSSKRKRFD